MAEKDILVFVRAQLADRVLCVFNRSDRTVEREFAVGPEFSDGSYRNEPTGATASVENGRIRVSVAPRSAAFIVRTSTR